MAYWGLTRDFFIVPVQVRREKAVYHKLNMLSIDMIRKCLVAEGWCPVSAKPKVRPSVALTIMAGDILARGRVLMLVSVDTSMKLMCCDVE